MHCVGAPCRNGCPGQVDVCTLNNAAAQENYYIAAKTLLTHNPIGWTCGMLCPTNHTCRGACTLADTYYGAVNINGIHTAVMDVFMNTNLPQIRDPSIKPQKYHSEKTALIGAGPASLSCATYLARLGYTDITIFEKRAFPGGTPAIEIPEFRIPYYITRFEVKLVEDLGVKIVYSKELGKDFTIPSLKTDGYKGIFIGCGYPEANVIKTFREAAKVCTNVYNSKHFLTLVCNASKPAMEKQIFFFFFFLHIFIDFLLLSLKYNR
jgi:dihydropyrimidine dehydrogenase (NADP+)